METSELFIGVAVLAALFVGLQIWRAENISGSYMSDVNDPVKISKHDDISKSSKVFVLVRGNNTYVLGGLGLTGSREVISNGIVAGELQMNMLTGELSLVLANSITKLAKLDSVPQQ